MAHSDAELKVLRRLVSRTRSATNKIAWRAGVQRRTSRIAGVVRSLPTLLRVPIVSRARGREGWLVSVAAVDGADCLALEIVTRVAARTAEELADPIVVRVHRRDLVDLARLERLQQSGKISVESVEAGS
jgi:hypothetical protein